MHVPTTFAFVEFLTHLSRADEIESQVAYNVKGLDAGQCDQRAGVDDYPLNLA